MSFLNRIERTFESAPFAGRPLLPLGHYANVLPDGWAVCTDGVGTKALLAHTLGIYDTIGIDCVAMNVNDIVCVGATPLSMTDYLAIDNLSGKSLDAIARGLGRGAALARVSICGGETANLPGMVTGFDLVGTCVGRVEHNNREPITGEHMTPGDIIIGLASSGIHANGLTLARRVLPDPDCYVPDLGRTVGEELLTPTTIYSGFAVDVFKELPKAFFHITGGGFTNLLRLNPRVSFVLDALPVSPPIFQLIQACGRFSSDDMHDAFNMGIGFCVVTDEAGAEQVIRLATKHGHTAQPIGRVVPSTDHLSRLTIQDI
jgi:phosphoribosylformylglycinamidine cyclo-ligase